MTNNTALQVQELIQEATHPSNHQALLSHIQGEVDTGFQLVWDGVNDGVQSYLTELLGDLDDDENFTESEAYTELFDRVLDLVVVRDVAIASASA